MRVLCTDCTDLLKHVFIRGYMGLARTTGASCEDRVCQAKAEANPNLISLKLMCDIVLSKQQVQGLDLKGTIRI